MLRVSRSLPLLAIILVLAAITFQSHASNIALRKRATQSGDWYGLLAYLAVDGDPSSENGQSHCASANTGDPSYNGSKPYAWWQVDLGASYTVRIVTVHNTNDSTECQYLTGFRIYVSPNDDISDSSRSLLCNKLDQGGVPVECGGTQTFNCTIPRVGRYVTIERYTGTSPTRMTLCEVEVEGERYYTCEKCQSANCSSSRGCAQCQTGYVAPACTDNIAFGKHASQSGVRYGLTANLAVDGDPSSENGQRHCASANTEDPSYQGSKPYAWWQVDLGASYTVSDVTVHNTNDSTDCRYLTGFRIYVSPNSDISDSARRLLCNKLDQGVVPVECGGSQKFSCTIPRVGRYVTIERYTGASPARMTICEVEVEGERYYTCEKCQSANCSTSRGCAQCHPGYMAPACTDTCNPGYYGTNCKSQCPSCPDTDEPCDRVTGQCPSCLNPDGCKNDPGSATQPTKSNDTGSKRADSPNRAVSSLCDKSGHFLALSSVFALNLYFMLSLLDR